MAIRLRLSHLISVLVIGLLIGFVVGQNYATSQIVDTWNSHAAQLEAMRAEIANKCPGIDLELIPRLNPLQS
jgi:hypothetical protein